MNHALRAYRKRTGISLDELASRAGTSKATLSRVENGKQSPSLGLLRRLIAATEGEVQASDFLAESGGATDRSAA